MEVIIEVAEVRRIVESGRDRCRDGGGNRGWKRDRTRSSRSSHGDTAIGDNCVRGSCIGSDGSVARGRVGQQRVVGIVFGIMGGWNRLVIRRRIGNGCGLGRVVWNMVAGDAKSSLIAEGGIGGCC